RIAEAANLPCVKCREIPARNAPLLHRGQQRTRESGPRSERVDDGRALGGRKRPVVRRKVLANRGIVKLRQPPRRGGAEKTDLEQLLANLPQIRRPLRNQSLQRLPPHFD